MNEISILNNMLSDNKGSHSDFQIDNFIATSNITDYGNYKQCLRELNGRQSNLLNLYHEKEKNQIKRDKLKHLANTLTDEFDLRENELELKMLEYNMGSFDVRFNEALNEFNRFFIHCKKLKEKIGELTEERIMQLEREYWIEKLKQSATFDVVTTNRISKGVLEALVKLDKKDCAAILSFLSFPQKDLILDKFTKDKNYSIDYKETKKQLESSLTIAEDIRNKIL